MRLFQNIVIELNVFFEAGVAVENRLVKFRYVAMHYARLNLTGPTLLA